jgi:hypothetical protein
MVELVVTELAVKAVMVNTNANPNTAAAAVRLDIVGLPDKVARLAVMLIRVLRRRQTLAEQVAAVLVIAVLQITAAAV